MLKKYENIVGLPGTDNRQIFPGTNIIILLAALILLSTIVRSQDRNVDTLLIASKSIVSNKSTVTQNHNIETNNADVTLLSGFLQRSYFSGDWWGERNALSEYGFDFAFVYKGEIFSNVYGGSEKGTTTLDNIDLILSADLGKSIGLNNTALTIQFLGNSGGIPCQLVGASQGISNIETIPTWKLYQLLLEKYFFDEKFSITAGLYDLNSEFDSRESSSIFINPSHGIGPDISKSGLNGPSIFPTTSVSIRLKYIAENGNYVQTAFLDGVPGDPDNPYGTHVIFGKNDGLLLITEAGLIKKDAEKLDSKVALGAWIYSSKSDNNYINNTDNNINVNNNYGVYLTAEKLLVSNYENHKNIYGFLRAGFANKNINPVDIYFGSGLKFTGLLSGKGDDEAGLAIAFAHNSLVFRNRTALSDNINIKPYELNLEATYMMHITQWLMIQPDVQYIINPSYCSQSDRALVMGSRMQFTF